MVHTKFVEIGLLVPKIFEGFYHKLYGCGGHFGHVTCIMFINFQFHASIQTLIKMAQWYLRVRCPVLHT